MPSIRRWTLRAACLATVALLPLPLAQAQPTPPPKRIAAPASEQVLRPGEPLRLRLGTRQDARTLRVAPEAGSDYTIVTRNLGRGVDTLLERLDASGRVVDQDDDGGDESLASSLEVTGASGATRIRVRTIAGPGEFEVVLTRDVPRGPADFPTSLSAARNAPPLAIGTPRRLRLLRGEEAFLALPEDARALGAFTRNLARNTDTVLALIDGAGRVVAEDDDSGDENLASWLSVPPGGRPLFLRVSGLSKARAEFDLVLEAEEPVAPPNFATSLVDSAARPPLAVGQPQRIELRRQQAAYFALPTGDGDLVALTRNLAANTDTMLRLVDGNGREVGEDDDGGDENLASRLEVPGGPARLFLQVTNITGRAGAFELVLERVDPSARPSFAASIEEARNRPAIVLGEAVPLTLRPGQPAVFALPEGTTGLEALTRNLGRGADSVLELLDADGTVLVEDDDGGDERLASQLDIPSGSRPLFLRATVLSRGSFELLVRVAEPVAPPDFATSIEQATTRPPIAIGQPLRIELRRRQSAFFRIPAGSGMVALTRDLGPDADTTLALLDADGRVLAEDDDGGDGLASRLALASTGKGNVFLRASSFGNRAASFELIVERR
ncbi:hypothetical protein [Roseococcus sp.]|uniref:hypothetical protein n=1 Tax=Roseococcus sp. TaxID=2109646 RepID=UPI003BA8D3CC